MDIFHVHLGQNWGLNLDTIVSTVDISGEEFKRNSVHHGALAEELHHRLAQIKQGGGAKYRRRQEAQGKLFVRERIERLLDPGSPFLELSPLAGWGLYDDQAPAWSLVSGGSPGTR